MAQSLRGAGSHSRLVFQGGGLGEPGAWCLGRGCRALLWGRLAKSGVLLGSRRLRRVRLARPLLHALTQQEHRPGAPRLACPGLPDWPGPSQAGAEHLHRVPQALPPPPAPPWPLWLSGRQALGTPVPSLEPLAEPSLGLPHSFPCIGIRFAGGPSKAGWVTWASPFPSVEWGYQTRCLRFIPDPALGSAGDWVPSLGRNRTGGPGLGLGHRQSPP